MLRFLYLTGSILVISFCLTMGATPVKPVKQKLVVRNDTALVTQRYFNGAALKNYSAQKEFQYGNGGYAGESLWTRFWKWFWSLFDTDDKSILGRIEQYVLIALGIAALVFLILKLVGVDALNVVRHKPLSATLPYNESVENIYETDLDAELEKAIAHQNYRFAVRILYLRSLRQLSDAGLIKWDINKTNSIYIDELTDAEQRIAFKILTRQFEYVWYGEFIIDMPVFTKISTRFNDFKVKAA